jgi:hypothetical protein
MVRMPCREGQAHKSDRTAGSSMTILAPEGRRDEKEKRTIRSDKGKRETAKS